MLNFYHKISICPGYQILSEENESFLLERSNTFYSTAIKIYNTDKIDESLFEDNENNENNNNDISLLFEEAKPFGIKNLISLIQSSNFNDKISFNQIKSYIGKTCKFYTCINQCTKRYPIVIFPINFSNPTQINWIKKEYKLETENKRGNLSLKEYQEKEIDMFKKALSDSNGCLFINNGIAFMFFNTQKGISRQTVIHELYHYFQEICDFDKITANIEKFYDIPELFLTKEKIQYLLSDLEFLLHINELAEIFTKLYFLKFNTKISKEQFLSSYLDFIETQPNKILKTKFFMLYKQVCKNDMSALVILPACKILNEEHLYKIGKSALERIFYKKIYFYQKEKG